MLRIRVKRGDTLQLRLRVRDEAGNPVSLAGWSVTADVLRSDGERGNFRFDAVNLPDGACDLIADDEMTAAWPLGVLACDILLRNPGGVSRRTSTFTIQADDPVTPWP